MITLALTHFNRAPLLLESLQYVIHDPRISEVVISDDASTDGSWQVLVDRFANIAKVQLFRNEERLDCYANKRMAVQRSSCKWVILFDSDNVIYRSYLDRLWEVKDRWHEDVAYLPDFAKPNFDYRAFSGVQVTRKNVAKMMGLPHFATMLNTANYFFNRESYLDVWDVTVNPHTADSIFQNYNWLYAGKELAVVRGLEYFHRVHENSHYKQNVHKTGSFAKLVESNLKELR